MKGYSCKEHGLPKLAPADVVLIRHRKNLFRYCLRKFLGADWDHAALVVFPRQEDGSVEHTIIAEAINERLSRTERDTVTLHRLDKYLSHPERYDVGVRRVVTLNDEERFRVVYYMIANVDAPYWGWNKPMVVIALFSNRVRRWLLGRQRFSCSSLIQKAFYDAVSRNDRKKIVFKQDTVTPLILQELTSPGDLARTERMEWILDPNMV